MYIVIAGVLIFDMYTKYNKLHYNRSITYTRVSGFADFRYILRTPMQFHEMGCQALHWGFVG
jgi:hypothetical protein